MHFHVNVIHTWSPHVSPDNVATPEHTKLMQTKCNLSRRLTGSTLINKGHSQIIAILNWIKSFKPHTDVVVTVCHSTNPEL